MDGTSRHRRKLGQRGTYAIFRLGNRNLYAGPAVQTSIVSTSSSASTSFFLILIALGGGVWLIKETLDPAPRPAPAHAAPEEEATSLPSRALDASQASGDSLNNSMNDQLKSVQGMVGGTYDGKTYVPPQSKK